MFWVLVLFCVWARCFVIAAYKWTSGDSFLPIPGVSASQPVGSAGFTLNYSGVAWTCMAHHLPDSVWVNESALTAHLCKAEHWVLLRCWRVQVAHAAPLSSHPHVLAWCFLWIIPRTHPGFIFKSSSHSLLPRIANLLSEAMLKENGKCELSSESLISVLQSEWSHMKE